MIIRGGSWFESDGYGWLRGDRRHPYEPSNYNYLIGFRCVAAAGE